jgi:hypothetical protein
MQLGLTSIHPEQGHRMAGDQSGRIQQGAVAPDGDDEIGPGREGLLGTERHAVRLECQADAGVHENRDSAKLKMRSKPQHTFGHAQVLGVAHQRNGLK